VNSLRRLRPSGVRRGEEATRDQRHEGAPLYSSVPRQSARRHAGRLVARPHKVKWPKEGFEPAPEADGHERFRVVERPLSGHQAVTHERLVTDGHDGHTVGATTRGCG